MTFFAHSMDTVKTVRLHTDGLGNTWEVTLKVHLRGDSEGRLWTAGVRPIAKDKGNKADAFVVVRSWADSNTGCTLTTKPETRKVVKAMR